MDTVEVTPVGELELGGIEVGEKCVSAEDVVHSRDPSSEGAFKSG